MIGEFDVGTILAREPGKLWQETKKYAGIMRAFFDAYFMKRATGFAIEIKNPKRYTEQVTLSEMVPGAIPPQSFRYI